MPNTLIWNKKLSATDAQRQDGHPTGDLRLTKAGRDINQCTYFRHDIFGHLHWASDQHGHEQATESFRVILLGEDHGVFDLTLSHRPDGHAEQNNYTTGLRWGETLRDLLHNQVDVTEKEVRISRVPEGEGNARFLLEVV